MFCQLDGQEWQMPVTLINVFIVPANRQEEFLSNWKRTTEVFSRNVGAIETHLHRNTGVGNGTFQFINIAKWESAEAWKTAHDNYTPTEYSVPGVKGHPAIYEAIVNIAFDGKGVENLPPWTW